MTKESIIEARKDNPCASMQSIADQLGISRQRVFHILKQAKLPTGRYRQKYICNHCGKEFIPTVRFGNLYCSRECGKIHRYKLHHVTITCSSCGKKKVIILSQYKNMTANKDVVFCSRECMRKFSRKRTSKIKEPTEVPKLEVILLPFWTGTFLNK